MAVALLTLALPLVLPLALVALLRARVLRAEAPDPARAWFGFWQATQSATLVAWIGWLMAQWWVQRHVPGLLSTRALAPWLAPAAGVCVALAPPALVSLAIVALTHAVSARLRGEGWARGEALRHAAWQLAGVVLPLAAFIAAVALAFRSEWRPAALWALAAAGSRWGCERQRLRALDLTPYSVTAGALRDRVFGLASAAGVRLRMLYIMPTARGRIANAFAVRGGVVLLTDHLLQHLSRREVDAVLAHELTHLRRGHARWMMAPMVVIVLATTFGGWSLDPLVLFPASFAAGLLATLLLMRRFEYQADRGAIELTRDPEALVSALAALGRLNHVPQEWGPWSGVLLTHPSVADRARAIGRAAGLDPARIEAVRRDGCGDADHHELPSAAAGKVFSTRRKAEYGLRVTLAMTAALALGAVLALALTAALAPGWPRPLTIALAAAAAFALALGVFDLLAARGVAGLRRSLAPRLAAEGIDVAGGRFVTLAPSARVRIYEGHTDWDAGFLFVRGDRLCYVGEETRFTLRRDEVIAVRLGARAPGWVGAPRVVLDWRGGAISLRPADVTRVSAGREASWRLLGVLGAWLDGLAEDRASAPCPSLDALGHPDLLEVTSNTPREAAHPRTLAPMLVVLALVVALACGLVGLPFGVTGTPGFAEAWLAASLAVVAFRLPWWRWRERAVPPAAAPPEQRRAA